MDRGGCAESEGYCGFGIDPKLSSFSLKKLAYPLFTFTRLQRVNQWPGMEACLRDGEGQKEKCIQRGWPFLGPRKLLCEFQHVKAESRPW